MCSFSLSVSLSLFFSAVFNNIFSMKIECSWFCVCIARIHDKIYVHLFFYIYYILYINNILSLCGVLWMCSWHSDCDYVVRTKTSILVDYRVSRDNNNSVEKNAVH